MNPRLNRNINVRSNINTNANIESNESIRKGANSSNKVSRSKSKHSNNVSKTNTELPSIKKAFVSEGEEYSHNMLPQAFESTKKSTKPFNNLLESYDHDLEKRDKFIDILSEHSIKEIGVKSIDISSISTLQSVVNKKKLSGISSKFDISKIDETSAPVIFQLPDGTNLLKDGNHRVNAAMLNGVKSMKFKVKKLI